MLKLLGTGALAAFTAAFALTGGDAQADHRQWFHRAPFFDFFGPGPGYYYYFDEPEPDRFYDYDEGYYEPRYEQPPRKKRKPAVASPDVEKKKKKNKVATAPDPKPKLSAAMSCGKATAIVTGYGFAAVKVEDCQGQVYAFNAKRDGKAYSIKLSAASGELTEVKKLQ